MRILVVEDEENLQKLLKAQFAFEKWDVTIVDRAEDAVEKLKAHSFDVIVLDWMLKGEMSGLDFCKHVARKIPIVMVTARSTPVDIVLALESGADDYITKPFEGAVLVARIRAVQRRAAPKQEVESMTVGTLEVFPKKFEARVNGKAVDLTTSEFKLLVAILNGRGTVLSRAALLSQIQEKGVTVVERIVDTHVYAIRKKLGSAADFIETIRGIGYRIKG